ncbi:hypothetical protein DL93DRAFT_1521366 [Clavulina sp. PMI_390]|nr:hypothetical protein DL93DRAFT_1521366 [Clavulina sp. PMI_390]
MTRDARLGHIGKAISHALLACLVGAQAIKSVIPSDAASRDQTTHVPLSGCSELPLFAYSSLFNALHHILIERLLFCAIHTEHRIAGLSIQRGCKLHVYISLINRSASAGPSECIGIRDMAIDPRIQA